MGSRGNPVRNSEHSKIVNSNVRYLPCFFDDTSSIIFESYQKSDRKKNKLLIYSRKRFRKGFIKVIFLPGTKEISTQRYKYRNINISV